MLDFQGFFCLLTMFIKKVKLGEIGQKWTILDILGQNLDNI
jgi:hypothetical protein